MKSLRSNFLLLFLFLLSVSCSYSQAPFSWKFILDGYNDVWLADIVVDNAGNSYVGV